MTPEAKKRHLKKIFNVKLISTQQSSTACSSSVLTSAFGNTQPKTQISNEANQHGLSVGWEECSTLNISESTLQNIWRTAEQLVTCTQKQILSVPWTSDCKSRLVKSSSSLHPHFVTSDPKNDQIFRCDDKCLMYKGFSFCSHVIAAAEDNGDLKSFLENVCISCTPNLSAIANSGMPSGSGRKGGVPKEKEPKLNHFNHDQCGSVCKHRVQF